MSFISILKGVIRRMLSPKTIESVLAVQPSVSDKMKNAIELWRDMYMDNSPWIREDAAGTLHSLGLAGMIASEKARTATIEMQIKVTGDNERAKYVKECYEKLMEDLRTELESGIALGSFVIKPYAKKGLNSKYTLGISYTKATDFYPLSFSGDGDIVEAAFIDRIVRKKYTYTKLEYHKLENNTLTIQSTAYESQNTAANLSDTSNHGELGSPISLSSVPEWAAIDPVVVINDIDMQLFAYFKMPGPNKIDLESPLGVSGFARAVDLIKDADTQYSNFLWEFEGGQLAVDVDVTALNPLKGPDGKIKQALPQRQERLFRHNLDLGEDNFYNVFNPDFRDTSLINGLNNILMHIEDVCEMSRGSLSEVTYAEARTATEMRILKQRSFAANKAIQEALEKTLRNFAKIVDKYCDLYEITPSGDFDIAYCWDDSIIVDKDTEKQMDLIEVEKGLMSKIEYRMKWYGETEEQAKTALKQVNEQKQNDLMLQQSVMNQANTGDATQRTESQTKLQKSNESSQVTKTNNTP